MKNADLKVPELQRYTWQRSGIRNDGKIKKIIIEQLPPHQEEQVEGMAKRGKIKMEEDLGHFV